ncbi:hypothetical protein P280DRAFT_468059 [Massarina eburnea CBS 473.64]|uniref:Ubiquitin carrier protein n=1 Tax=Massarina eburnea CBS 473.64 TaxID=1395130 RepID=A0A6A6S970_9PLEO|nr:hypothetical protein P280DRAFT_468059 [Massarina eburnea CBS 473.64]
MIEHVVRRGLEHAGSMNLLKRAAEDGPKVELPTWGAILLAVTFIGTGIFLTLVEYTLKDLIATLAMIETPSAAITVSTPDEPASKDEKEGLLETAPTITLVHQKPITSSIRATMRHLKSQAGRMARLRGFRIHALYAFAFSSVLNMLNAAVPMRFPLRMVIISALGGAVCAPIHAAWTNKVVSTPSATTFWQRIPSRSSWKVLALPAAVNAAMPYFALFVAHASACLLGLHKVKDVSGYTSTQWTFLILRVVAVIAISITCSLFLCLPAIVTLVRTEASILPEDQDTIVPFDRSFDGKVVPKILGGTGAIKFLDAWRSFNWEARRRLLKHYVKSFLVVFGMIFVVAHILAFELFVVMGPQLGKLLAEAKHQGYIS